MTLGFNCKIQRQKLPTFTFTIVHLVLQTFNFKFIIYHFKLGFGLILRFKIFSVNMY